MKRQSVHISIPKPCHESWDRMDMTEHGAFCQSCQTEVVDFSAMTDREVIEYLAKHETGCGRFRKEQVDTKLSIPQVDNGIFKWKALLLGMLPMLVFKYTKANQIYHPTERVSLVSRDATDTSAALQNGKVIIEGRVLDEKGEGVAEAAVSIVETKTQHKIARYVTGSSGKFALSVDRDSIRPTEQVLRVSGIDLVRKEISITDQTSQFYNIILKSEPYVFTGETVIMGKMIARPKTPAQKIRLWFRRTFGIRHRS